VGVEIAGALYIVRPLTKFERWVCKGRTKNGDVYLVSNEICGIELVRQYGNVRSAKVTGKISKGWLPDLYYVGYRDGRFERAIGWALVRDVRVGASAWNEDMRKCNSLYAVWHDTGIALSDWRRDVRIVPENYQPVQLTTVYPVHALTEFRSAELAVQMLIHADQNYMEWYDATPDLRWTKLLGHYVSPEPGVTTRFGLSKSGHDSHSSR
jgi:hypothetical protein